MSGRHVPPPQVLDLIFQELPLLELAAASLHGEQAMANLLKVRLMAAGPGGSSCPHAARIHRPDVCTAQGATR